MKTKILILYLIALTVAACSGNKQEKQSALHNDMQYAMLDPYDISGKWYIENIFFNDSTYIRPSEQCHASCQYILFESGGEYSVMTNCNHAAGTYTLSNTNISFQEAAWTELACDNMTSEEALRKILPLLRRVEIENDSVMRINSDSEPYLILIKAKEI